MRYSVAYSIVETSALGLLPALRSHCINRQALDGIKKILDMETHTKTLPSGSKLAVEWYIRAIVVSAKPSVNLSPTGAEGWYSHGVKTG